MIRNPLLAWSIAAIAALSAVLLGQRYLAARAELTLLRDQRTLADVALKTAQAQIESEQILTRGLIEHAKASAADSTTAAASPHDDSLAAVLLHPTRGTNITDSAVVVYDTIRRRGLLIATTLPANTAEDRYVLWLAGAQPTQIAEFRRSSDGATQIAFALPSTVASTPLRLLVSRETTARAATAPGTIILATD